MGRIDHSKWGALIAVITNASEECSSSLGPIAVSHGDIIGGRSISHFDLAGSRYSLLGRHGSAESDGDAIRGLT